MATLSREIKGDKTTPLRLYVTPPGTTARKLIYLGRLAEKHAETIRRHVTELEEAAKVGVRPAVETVQWLASIDPKLHGKLVQHGLAATRQQTTLGPWLDEYLGSCSDLKPASLVKLRQTATKLVQFFGPTTPLRSLTPDAASRWRTSLAATPLTTATVKTHSGNAKTLFTQAVDRKLIDASPFDHLPSGSTPSADRQHVTQQQAAAVVAFLPDAEWRLLFGLARYAGLRSPSETSLLTPADVDLSDPADPRLTVRSPKTERHPGHATRQVPVTLALLPLLQDRLAELAHPDAPLVTKLGGNVRRTLHAAIKAAGLDQWPDLMQALRSSCEQDMLNAGLPEYAVTRWIGHNVATSRKHYTHNVVPEVFQRAAQIPAQHPPERPSTAQQSGVSPEDETPHNPAPSSTLAQVVAVSELGGGGNRTPVP